MNIKILAAAAAISTCATAASAAPQLVTPEQVLKLPVGTTYHDKEGAIAVVRTAKGFNIRGPLFETIECNNVTKSGGHGNATVNCTAKNKAEFRFEWIDINYMKIEIWENMAAKAGAKKYKPTLATDFLYRW